MVKKLSYILIGSLLLLSIEVYAQLVNRGATIFLDQNSLLYVNDKVQHHDGHILNHGEMVVAGNWVNNHITSPVFDENSLGVVRFKAPNASFLGVGYTVFPGLILESNGVFDMHTKIAAKLYLDLGNAELRAGNHQISLLNPDPLSLNRDKGYISTGSEGSFVRTTNSSTAYLYPLGSSNLNLMRFVSVKPTSTNLHTFSVSFVDKDPNFDGYSRLNKTARVAAINDSYYHVLKRIAGANGVEVSFYTSLADEYTELASWGGTQWDEVNNHHTASLGLNRLIVHPEANLPLGIKIPYAFAKIEKNTPLEFYNAFSPDGDGKNDTWEVKNIDYYPDNDIKIYDRSGNLVYRMSNYNSSKFWDGQNVSSGTYMYIMRVKINSEDKYYKGAVTMVKD